MMQAKLLSASWWRKMLKIKNLTDRRALNEISDSHDPVGVWCGFSCRRRRRLSLIWNKPDLNSLDERKVVVVVSRCVAYEKFTQINHISEGDIETHNSRFTLSRRANENSARGNFANDITVKSLLMVAFVALRSKIDIARDFWWLLSCVLSLKKKRNRVNKNKKPMFMNGSLGWCLERDERDTYFHYYSYANKRQRKQ